MFRNIMRQTLVVTALVLIAPLTVLAADPRPTPSPSLEDPDVYAGGLPRRGDAEDVELSAAFEDLLDQSGALGYYLDGGGDIIVVVPASGSSSLTMMDASRLGINLTIETRDIERTDLDEIFARVIASDWRPQMRGAYPPLPVFFAERGVVRIYTDAPASEFQDLLSKFAGKIDFVGRPIVKLSRTDDVEAHWGGARLVSPSTPSSHYCTSGFAVRNEFQKQRMLTAGHCWGHGVTVKSPQGTTFGTVKETVYDPDVITSLDVALVGASDVTHEGRIYTGVSEFDNSTKPVSGAANPLFGYGYCFSGATEYRNCGGFRPSASVFPNVFVFPEGKGPCYGDSGAPFYYDNLQNVGARGIIQGGDPYVTPEGEIDFATCKAESTTAIVVRWPTIVAEFDTTIMTIPYY